MTWRGRVVAGNGPAQTVTTLHQSFWVILGMLFAHSPRTCPLTPEIERNFCSSSTPRTSPSAPIFSSQNHHIHHMSRIQPCQTSQALFEMKARVTSMTGQSGDEGRPSRLSRRMPMHEKNERDFQFECSSGEIGLRTVMTSCGKQFECFQTSVAHMTKKCFQQFNSSIEGVRLRLL